MTKMIFSSHPIDEIFAGIKQDNPLAQKIAQANEEIGRHMLIPAHLMNTEETFSSKAEAERFFGEAITLIPIYLDSEAEETDEHTE